MTSLYSCRRSGEGFVVTKFDGDLNHEADYLTSFQGCTCPAGSKATCRHRQMLFLFVERKHVDDGWLLCWDTKFWHRPMGDVAAWADAPSFIEPPPLHPDGRPEWPRGSGQHNQPTTFRRRV